MIELSAMSDELQKNSARDKPIPANFDAGHCVGTGPPAQRRRSGRGRLSVFVNPDGRAQQAGADGTQGK
jgi:hypothetical protein